MIDKDTFFKGVEATVNTPFPGSSFLRSGSLGWSMDERGLRPGS